MQYIINLEYDRYYHIYNRGINSENIFRSDDNYEYFLRLYRKHISPIAETYAWCLMKNHFHFLIKIKKYGEVPREKVVRIKSPHHYFSNLFNAYAKAFNKRFNRHGSLFERPFNRKLVDNEDYFKTIVVYIHNNPVHHGFVDDLINWSWSSYMSCISSESIHLECTSVIDRFENIENFKNKHKQDQVDVMELEKYLGIRQNSTI